MKNSLFRSGLVIISSFIIVVTVVSAWVAPTTPPPDPNASAPINVSANSQVKLGGLGVASLLVTGNAQINGKATSASTVSTDGGTTLVTKDYITNKYRSGTATVGFFNGQPHSTFDHVTFSPACNNPIITTQTMSDSILCGNGSGPTMCVNEPGSDSTDLHSYAINVTSTGFDAFLSTIDGVWVGATSPAFRISWIAVCN